MHWTHVANYSIFHMKNCAMKLQVPRMMIREWRIKDILETLPCSLFVLARYTRIGKAKMITNPHAAPLNLE